tara:strand:+ start:5266 stop:5646 length:381 start_codon:yes stop_codon:yes gene_type:complete
MSQRSINPEIIYASAVYDVSGGIDLGTQATHIPKRTSYIPNNACIVSVVIDTVTAFVGGANTLKVLAGGEEITAATSIANRSLTVPYVNVLPKKATSDRQIKVTVGAANITAGKCIITVGYFLGME